METSALEFSLSMKKFEQREKRERIQENISI